MSPELFDPEIQDYRRTERSDCYALGMVIYEVLSGHVPFPQHSGYAAATKVLKGERPERPLGVGRDWLSGEVWEVMQRCWVPQPGNRPSIEAVLGCLEKVSRSWVPPLHLLAVQSTVGSLTWGATGVTTGDSMDWSGALSPSQPPEKLYPRGPAGIVDMVSCMRLLDGLWY